MFSRLCRIGGDSMRTLLLGIWDDRVRTCEWMREGSYILVHACVLGSMAWRHTRRVYRADIAACHCALCRVARTYGSPGS